jgi:hypothetical protein
VHDDAGRLVDDQQVRILVRDPQLALLRLEAGRRRLGPLELELFAAGEPVALGPDRAVDADGCRPDEPLRLGPRPDLGERGEKPVEALAGGAVGNAQPSGQLRCAPASMTVAKRIATPTQMNVSARLNAGQ